MAGDQSTSIDAANTSNWTATMRRHFNTTNKYMRNKWTNVATLTHNTTAAMAHWPGKAWQAQQEAFSPLLLIALITFVALGCWSVA